MRQRSAFEESILEHARIVYPIHREGRRTPRPVRVGKTAPAPLCALRLLGCGAPARRRETGRPPLPSHLNSRGVGGKQSVPADHGRGQATLLARRAGPGRSGGGACQMALSVAAATAAPAGGGVAAAASPKLPASAGGI